MARPRVLVFGASNSRRSINRQFAVHAADVLNQQTEGGVEIEVLDLNDFEMPIYSPERQEATGIPAEAQAKACA
ncbi:MAG: NAD(P)H-dependent oxidoreductase, partial [Pseudomonadota bacterium]